MTSTPIPPAPPGATPPNPQNGQVVKIVSLPDGLKDNARGIRIEGEVVQQNKDGSTRIATAKGDIDINIRGKQLPPGTKVEVDIPAGSPPRNVTVRPAPAQPNTNTAPPADTPETPVPQTPVTKPVETPRANNQQTQTRPAPAPQTQTPASLPDTVGTTKPSTPLPPVAIDDGQIAPSPTTPTVAKPVLPPLTAGTVVTLTPLSEESPQTFPPVPQARPAATAITPPAQTSAPSTPDGLLGNLLQTVKSVLGNATIFGAQSFRPPANVSAPPAQTAILPAQIPPVTLQAKITTITLPSGQVLTAPSEPAPATPVATTPALTITVNTLTSQGQPILPIPVSLDGVTTQNFVLQTPPATVPIGTQITLQPQLGMAQPGPGLTVPSTSQIQNNTAITVAAPTSAPTPSNIAALPPAWRALLPLMQPASLWPAMDDLFQAFYQATPQAAQILARTIPSPANPQNFGASLILFAAAIKSGNLEEWLGQKKLDMVQKIGKADVVSRLSSETAPLTRNADTPATEWKSFPVPILWQNEISKVMFHVRREPDEDQNNNPELGTRFLLDLSLTRMGNVQLDGLLRGSRLNLIVRTEMPISYSMQEAMKRAYADALDGSAIYGELGFQGDLKGCVHVYEETREMSRSI